jgi:MFS family permease
MREAGPQDVGGRYAKYVLFVLVIVYVFNFIDRQILSILAEDIKADLGITDAQIGFLYGTAFAVFYAVFGIPLGRLADVWVRRSLIASGLIFWSAMTALSGTARSFLSLAVFRFGVGVGEASASPAAFSMLADYFPPRLRATAISIYSSGIYIGAGLGIFIGGTIVDGWNGAYPVPSDAPFGLKGWQAAFMAVGLPGLLMGAWVWTLREPIRGMSEGVRSVPHPAPFRATLDELMAVLPPLTLVSLARSRAGVKGFAVNLGAAAAIAVGAWVLTMVLGGVVQWTALGIGVYATFSWGQSLALRDAPAFALIFRTKALMFAVIGFASISFITYGIGFWGAPFFIRVHGASASDVGVYLGLAAAAGGWIGVTAGGVLSDHFKARSPRARIWVGLSTALASIVPGLTVLYTDSLVVAYVANFLFSVLSPMWVGCAASTVADLVLPRMRALASSFYILMNTFIGLALGPYAIGRLSDGFAATGMEGGEALRTAMACAFGMFAFITAMLLVAARNVERDEGSRFDRARTAGEPDPDEA